VKRYETAVPHCFGASLFSEQGYMILRDSKMISTKLSTLPVLAILIISVMVMPVGFAQDTNGEETPDTTIESLLKILERSRDRVNAAFERLEDRGIAVPDAAKEKYSEGLGIVAVALQLGEAGEFEQANQKALQAMQKFREALLEIADEMEETETPVEKEAYRVAVQTAARNRVQIYIDKLETLADRAEELGYNVTRIRKTLTEARNYTTNAINLAEVGDVDKAGGEVGKAVSTAAKTMGELQPIVKANKVKQTQKFIEKAEERLVVWEGNMGKLSEQVSPQAQQAINQTMVNARNRVKEAQAVLKAGDVQVAVEKLREMNRDTERSVEEFRAVKPDSAEKLVEIKEIDTMVRMLGAKLEWLEKQGVDVSEIAGKLETAKSLLAQAMEDLQNGEVEAAADAINKATDLVKEAKELLYQAAGQVQQQEPIRGIEKKTIQKRLQSDIQLQRKTFTANGPCLNCTNRLLLE